MHAAHAESGGHGWFTGNASNDLLNLPRPFFLRQSQPKVKRPREKVRAKRGQSDEPFESERASRKQTERYAIGTVKAEACWYTSCAREPTSRSFIVLRSTPRGACHERVVAADVWHGNGRASLPLPP